MSCKEKSAKTLDNSPLPKMNSKLQSEITTINVINPLNSKQEKTVFRIEGANKSKPKMTINFTFN